MGLTFEERVALRKAIDCRIRETRRHENGSLIGFPSPKTKLKRNRQGRYFRRKRRLWENQGLIKCGEDSLKCLTCGRVSHKFNWRTRHEDWCPNKRKGDNGNRANSTESRGLAQEVSGDEGLECADWWVDNGLGPTVSGAGD